MPTISIHHAEYYYELHGQGHPLVLVSGYTVDYQGWLTMLDQLTKYFQVLIFDNRGVGQTRDDGGVLTAELMAKDTVALCEKLKLDKPHFVGQSMGGTIVQAIASQYPEAVSKIVLLTTTMKWRRAALFALRSHLLLRENKVDLHLILESVIPWIFGEAFLADAKKIEAFKKMYLDDPKLQSIADQKRQYNVLQQFDGLANLAKINAQTLVIHALEDEFVLPQESVLLATKIANAFVAEIESGHAAQVEMPNALAQILIDFLQ